MLTTGQTPVAVASSDIGTRRARYKWELLLWFWLAFFLNQGDRQIYNAVLPLIKIDLAASDVELGLVATGFTLVYGALVGVAGWLSDRFSKKWIVCLSLLIFSVGTLLTGLSTGLLGLMLFRAIATGIGEAFYYPAANALIAQHHRETRALAMGIHQTANYLGLIVSSLLAAYLGERFGWRTAFYAFGSIGLLLAAVLAVRLRNNQARVAPRQTATPFLRQTLGILLRNRTLYLLSIAFGCLVFVHVGFMTWMPTYLYEVFHLSLKQAAFQAVFLHLLAAGIGVLIGGRLADRHTVRRPAIRIEIQAAGLLLGAPFIYLLGQSFSLLMVYVALAAFGFFRGLYDSNIFATLFDVIEVEHRATATGLMLSFAFISGALAPVALGYIRQYASMSTGLSVLSLVFAIGGCALLAAKYLTLARDFRHEPA